jgi:hypothetical protein
MAQEVDTILHASSDANSSDDGSGPGGVFGKRAAANVQGGKSA